MNEIVVIQCAASKQRNAGHLRLGNGREVLLVARPDSAPTGNQYAYAHPDDAADTGETWREKLLGYNSRHRDAPIDNPLRLLPAWRLYQHPVYAQLAGKYGLERLYILSAGWGLIRADFLTPNYDITFSNSAEDYKRRRPKDSFNDWRMLPDDTTDSVVFFGGKSYAGLFCSLTNRARGAKYLFYNSQSEPDAPGCQPIKFNTKTRTNWHYECAQAFMDGKIGI